MLNFRNDDPNAQLELTRSVQYGGYHQVKKYCTEPQVDENEEVEQFAFFRVLADAERQIDEKRQGSEQDYNHMHRLLCLGNYARCCDCRHIHQAANRGARGYDMRRNVATEQDGTDGNSLGTGFVQVHRDVRSVEIWHNQ